MTRPTFFLALCLVLGSASAATAKHVPIAPPITAPIAAPVGDDPEAAAVSVPDTGSTLALFGLGLGGLALARYRFKLA